MFIKKGTYLKIKTTAQLLADSSLKYNFFGFCKNETYLNKDMLKIDCIEVPKNCNISNGFSYLGWFWYDWMFDLSKFKKNILIEAE